MLMVDGSIDCWQRRAWADGQDHGLSWDKKWREMWNPLTESFWESFGRFCVPIVAQNRPLN
jgi:hypothetical protein